MPIFQLFIPANAKAVAYAYDYLCLTPKANFLETLCVTKISKADRLVNERRTLGQDRKPLWSDERKKTTVLIHVFKNMQIYGIR